MAAIEHIDPEDEKIRTGFAQHHYTILESLYFMQCIADEVSQTEPVSDFDSYRKLQNQIMAFQAYSGRLRDNMEKCFIKMTNKNQTDKAVKRLDAFYHQRHIFIHGRKVPFVLDHEQLFMIARVKNATDSQNGFGLEMSWESVRSKKDLQYLEDALMETMNQFKPLVNSILSNLLEYVKKFIDDRNLRISSPWPLSADAVNLDTDISGSLNKYMPSSGAAFEFPGL